MKSEIVIKRITGTELTCLKKLWIELNDYHVPIALTFPERFMNVSFEDHISFLLNQDTQFSYIAMREGEIIGFIIAFTKGDYAELDSIYVSPSYRHGGIGDILMRKAMNELVGSYNTIVFQVAEGNEQPSHARYGFKKRYTLFQYDYGDDGESAPNYPMK